MDVKIVSEELVEPSSPTPPHLKTFKLSLLDQFNQSPYAAVVLFYFANSEQRPLELLKRSLSQALAYFYPLAGKVQDEYLIQCDDWGARFVEASVAISLRQFLSDPDLIFLNNLIPSEEPLQVARATNVQVTVFECGGIALGVNNNHKLNDGTGLAGFIKEWAAISRSGGSRAGAVPVRDLMMGLELFPPVGEPWLRQLSRMNFEHMIKEGNCTTRRFAFNRDAIETLSGEPNRAETDPSRGDLWVLMEVGNGCLREKEGRFQIAFIAHNCGGYSPEDDPFDIRFLPWKPSLGRRRCTR